MGLNEVDYNRGRCCGAKMTQLQYFSKLYYKTFSNPNYNYLKFSDFSGVESFWHHSIDILVTLSGEATQCHCITV